MKEKTIQQRRLEILDWEKNNRNINNRALDSKKNCSYAAGIGCAVGRIIKDKNLCLFFDSKAASAVDNEEIFYALPDEIQELGCYFLTELQYLHDNPGHWNETGLSPEGQEKYNFILQTFCTINP
jgi:hypothetical protein